MIREIVNIDRDKCNGCGICIPNCHEGALQMIDGKATLISELMCDGLGACIGHCPEGAITIEKREAEPYNETEVIKNMIPMGANVILAHLQHLKEHNELGFLKEGVSYLKQHQAELDFDLDSIITKVHNMNKKEPEVKVDVEHKHHHHGGGCPGSKAMSFAPKENEQNFSGEITSQLQQWPVQLHLINPAAGYFQGADLLIAADCTAFTYGDFHRKFLKDKRLVIACPKLDDGSEIYVQKISALIDNSKVNTITVMIMEVPCCHGLVQMVRTAQNLSERKVPVKLVVIGIKGDIVKDEWL